MSNKLSSYVTVRRQFLRSVRLDADMGRDDAMQGYILQASAQAVLEATANHFLTSQQRAFTWTGPYGGGKSSLALAFASLVGGSDALRKVARSSLGFRSGSPLYKAFCTKEKWAVLPVVGKRAPIADEIGLAIDTHLPGVRGRKPQIAGRRDVIAELVRAAEAKTEFGGVVLIVDELGKFLEHAAHTGEDVGFYQDLAEAASRCKGNLIVIGILHQAFEQYASRLGPPIQQEWAKVQGRYVDIPLVAGSDEVVALIGRALEVSIEHTSSIKIANKVAKVIKKRRPSAGADIAPLMDSCWPIHPVTAALLGPASRKRFGQNERSVFSFLASAEPVGFTEILGGLEASASSYYWPFQFWDYLRTNFEPAIAASSDSHRWALCEEAIERTEARFSRLHVEIVKTIGLIELLRNGTGLAAELDLLKVSVRAADAKNVEDALNELTAASILIFRKHLDAYGVYAGSDFDIEAALRNAKAQLGTADITRLGELVELGPVTARRHYWNTGAMRWFSRNVIYAQQVESYVAKFAPSGSQCGEFLLVLSDQHHTTQSSGGTTTPFRKPVQFGDSNGITIGVPPNSSRVEDLIQELAALEFVRKNSQQLDGDDIAMREVTARLQATKAMLLEELRDGFQNAVWHYEVSGKAHKRVSKEGLSHLASEIADTVFSCSPVVHSELINRDSISSNAAKAQKELLHAMLTSSAQPNLGYTSFSADAGLYRTVVKAVGLHREIAGTWRFADPAETSRSGSMKELWSAAEQLVFNSKELIRLDSLYAEWRRRPFGVKSGLMPIFALAFFMANRHQLALYVEGMFTPDINEAHIDEWLQDPTRIAWRFVRIEGDDREMLKALAAALTKRLGHQVATDVLDSARALVSMVYQLPPWARRTMLVSKEAQDVRRLLLNATDPHKVLFADLPLVLQTRSPLQLAHQIAEIAGELTDIFGSRLRNVEVRLINALDCDGDLNALNARAAAVSGIGSDFKLDAFSSRLSQFKGAQADIEGLLMLAIGKSTKDWSDPDIDAGEMQLLTWAMEFRRLESLAQIRGRPANRRAIGVVFASKRTVTGTFDVSENDSVVVKELANDLLAQVNTGKMKREVLLAAIAEVGASLFEQISELKELE